MNPYQAHHHENDFIDGSPKVEHPVAKLVTLQEDPKIDKVLLPETHEKLIVTPSPQKRKDESAALQEELDQELIDAVEQAHKDRVDEMVTKWRIKQKLIKAVEELEVCRKRHQEAEERHQQELRVYEEEQRQKRELEQMQFFRFEGLFASDRTNSIVVGPVNYGLRETRCRLGDYKVGKMMGSGFYSQVYLGTHLRTRERFAIKKLPKKNITHMRQLDRVKSEISVLKNTTHPNIVDLYDVVHAPKTICLVMELGVQDLQQFCSQHVHDFADLHLREVALGILEPLWYLHSKGIAHMDLKPENIILSEKVYHPCDLSRHHLKLCDFGLCVQNPNASLEHVVNKGVYIHGFWGGTPGFFAPEMVLRQRGVPCEGCRADMWSFGCTMMELSPEGFPGRKWLDSYRLYKKNALGFQQGLLECLDTIRNEEYFVDKAFGDFVTNLLRLDPTERMGAREALEHYWFSIKPFASIDNDEMEAPGSSGVPVTDSPLKRPRTC